MAVKVPHLEYQSDRNFFSRFGVMVLARERCHGGHTGGFTLIELLVVIAIIPIRAALLPSDLRLYLF